jgi:uncharacterized protein (DUF983 family)
MVLGKAMRKNRPAITSLLLRCLMLRCPVCGGQSIAQRPFQIRHHCTSCGALFKREDGFFVGAIMANVMTTEFLILVVYLISLPLFSFEDQLVIRLLIVLAVLFPLAFYHHSWSLWLSFDHLIETLPRYVDQYSRPAQKGSELERKTPESLRPDRYFDNRN